MAMTSANLATARAVTLRLLRGSFARRLTSAISVSCGPRQCLAAGARKPLGGWGGKKIGEGQPPRGIVERPVTIVRHRPRAERCGHGGFRPEQCHRALGDLAERDDMAAHDVEYAMAAPVQHALDQFRRIVDQD